MKTLSEERFHKKANNMADGWVIRYEFGPQSIEYRVTFLAVEAMKADESDNVTVRPFQFCWPIGGVAMNPNPARQASDACPDCGGTNLSWDISYQNNSGVVEGRLRTHDITCFFVLGCNECSGTVRVVRAEDVAARELTAAQPVYQAFWIKEKVWEDITKEQYDALEQTEAGTRILYALSQPIEPQGAVVVTDAMVKRACHEWDVAHFVRGDDAKQSMRAVLKAALQAALPVAVGAGEWVAEITGIDEYGPMLAWNKHWVDVGIGTKLYAKGKP